MNRTFKKTISCFLIIAFLFTIVLPLRETHAMTAPWWSGSQAHGYTNIDPAPSNLGNSILSDTDKHCTQGEPVFIHNGEFVYEHSDLVIPSRAINTEITRLYKSQSRYNNRFGYGWDIFYNKRIVPLCNGDLHYLNGKLNRYIFKYIDGTNYISPQGIYDTIVQNPDGTFTLTEPHKTVSTFDQNGVLTEIKDRNNNSFHFTYDQAGKLPIIGTSVFSNDPEPKIIAYDYKLTTITDTVNRQIILGYDDNGRCTTITDFDGRIYSYSYDPSVNGDLLTFTTPSTEEYPEGLTTTYTYEDHNLATITDAKEQTFLTNHYDANDRVCLQDYGLGHFSFSYDSPTQTTVTDPKGFITVWTFDSNGNPTIKKEYTQGLRPNDPPFYETTYTYNNNLEKTSVTYPKGNGIKYTFDDMNQNQLSRGNLLEIRRKPDMSAPDNNEIDIVTTFTYEPNFNFIKTITDPEGNITTFTYDYELPPEHPDYGQAGNLVKITYPQVNGQTPETLFTYNQYGQLEMVTDPNNNATRYEYYAATGYLWQIIQDPGESPHLNYVTEFNFDAVGNPQSIINARGHTTTFEYNALNQLKRTFASSPFYFETKYSYDENGNQKKIERQTNDSQNPWQTTEYTYTILDQFQTIKQYKDPTNYLETSLTYDLNGNRHTIIDPEQKTTIYDYDERNLIWKETDALTQVTEYSYDHNGNREVDKDAKNQSTTYAYDDFDRVETTTYHDGSFKRFTYDKNSNLKTKNTNDDPQTQITYDYDVLNRLDFKTYPDLSIVDYGYDLGSRLESVVYGPSTVGYTYDAVNRVETSTNTVNGTPYTNTYQYDEVGNRKQLIYPHGQVLNYIYDELNRQQNIKISSQNFATYQYDALSRRKRLDLHINHTFSTYAYDWLNQLTNVTNKAYNVYPVPWVQYEYSRDDRPQEDISIDESAPPYQPDTSAYKQYQYLPITTTISKFDYTYDDAGNRETMNTITVKPGIHNYVYDDVYQLEDVTYPSGTPLNINYDFDNVGNRDIVTIDGTPTDYVPNSLNQYDSVGGQSYTYDQNGNLESDGVNSYTYDVENRLISAIGNGHTSAYTYDGFGRRVSKTVDGTTTYFIYDGDQVIEERNSAGSLLANYIYGSGIDEVLRTRRGSTNYYYHYDGLGSVSDITNTNHTVVERYSYDVYGQPLIKNQSGQTIPTSAIGNRYMFTGREYDQETGLYGYRSRMHSSTIGRFLQRDSIGYFASMNLFAYSFNSPVNFIDPKGFNAYIGGHKVYGPGGHTAIILEVEPEDEQYFLSDSRFKRNPATGRLECDVSAGPSEGRLRQYSYDQDRKGSVSIYISKPIKDTKGRSDIVLFNDILNSAAKYNNQLYYDPFALGGCYNSNSYVRGVLKDSGISDPPLPTDELWFPGWTKPIPLEKECQGKE